MWSLLDADQEIPWADQPLEYFFKFRFWFQEYQEKGPDGKPSHLAIKRGAGYDIGAGPSGAGAEFDVPKCAEGMDGCTLEDGTWVYTTTGTMKGSGKLVAAHFHWCVGACVRSLCLSPPRRCPPLCHPLCLNASPLSRLFIHHLTIRPVSVRQPH